MAKEKSSSKALRKMLSNNIKLLKLQDKKIEELEDDLRIVKQDREIAIEKIPTIAEAKLIKEALQFALNIGLPNEWNMEELMELLKKVETWI